MFRFGLITGNDAGKRCPMKAGQYFRQDGACFVTFVDGVAELASLGSQKVDGYAVMPKALNWDKLYYLTQSGDDMLIQNSADAVFRVPAKNAVTAAEAGKQYSLGYTGTIDANSFLQYVVNDGTNVAAAQVIVQDVDEYDIKNQCLKVKLA